MSVVFSCHFVTSRSIVHCAYRISHSMRRLLRIMRRTWDIVYHLRCSSLVSRSHLPFLSLFPFLFCVGLNDSSHLFRHEVAFVLGQRQEPRGVATLSAVLSDPLDHPMVRHEAGEALGAIATPECLAPLEAHVNDPVLEVAETCRLALERLRYYTDGAKADAGAEKKELGREDAVANGAASEPASSVAAASEPASSAASARLPTPPSSPSASEASESGERRYLSVDPAPAASRSVPTSALRELLLDESAPIFERYRAMFGLRDRGGPEAVEALAAGFSCRSALLKHELAYVLGQMQDAVAIDALERVLRDADEAAMVRHEAAEALGAIADERCVGLLREHAVDPEPIVADSCVVALDVLDSEQRGEFQYADMGLPEEEEQGEQGDDGRKTCEAQDADDEGGALSPNAVAGHGIAV